MATKTITIQMDEELKQQAEVIFADMGLNMTTAFTIFTKAVVRQNKIPFEIAADPFYSVDNHHIFFRAIVFLEAGKGQIHEIVEVDDE